MFESWDSFASGGIFASLEEIENELRKQGFSQGEIDDKLAQILSDSIQQAISVTGPSIAKSLLRDAPRMLAEHRDLREGFEFRLRWIWGEALDLLYGVMVCCSELGEAFHFAYRSDVAEDDFRFEALVRLHARACLIASEIHALLRAGHAWGAQARWRTLHEISVVAAVLGDGNQELARRYLIHCQVEECRDIELDIKYGRLSGDEAEIAEQVEEIARIREEARNDFGPSFKKPWGWSAMVFDKGDPNFERLEELAELDNLRPHYRTSSHLIHGGSTGTSMILKDSDEGQFFATGPNNAGLSEPGQCCAISVLQVTHSLIAYARSEDPNPLLLSGINSIQLLQNQAMKAMVSAEERVEKLTQERRIAVSKGRMSFLAWNYRIRFEQRVWQFQEFLKLQHSRTGRVIRRLRTRKVPD
jgi:hypothetical protein